MLTEKLTKTTRSLLKRGVKVRRFRDKAILHVVAVEAGGCMPAGHNTPPQICRNFWCHYTRCRGLGAELRDPEIVSAHGGWQLSTENEK